jgi:type I site-specific restriction-modification system R (restriction) subunit
MLRILISNRRVQEGIWERRAKRAESEGALYSRIVRDFKQRITGRKEEKSLIAGVVASSRRENAGEKDLVKLRALKSRVRCWM